MHKLIATGMRIAFVLMVFGVIGADLLLAQETETLKNAFKKGTFSGAIGSYYEYTDKDADDSDFGWATGYFTFKYETLSWHDLQLGVRFFNHNPLYSHDDGATDPFDVDVESRYTLPELYLNYSFAERSHLTVGRWEHLAMTHIDDNQSEGGYVQFKEIEGFELTAGAMRRFAEIDYDDGEDFGRNNGSQDLDSESTYGPGSGAQLYFLEGKYKGIDRLTLNPYIMYHNDYASVYGIDTRVEGKIEDPDLTFGGEASYYRVNAEIAGSGDANNYMVAPFVKVQPVYVSVGYARFDDGDALTKPAWLRDYFLPVDQVATYGTPDSDVVFGKLKLTFGDFWTHFILADTKYATTAGRGDGSQEYELQFGYKLFKRLDPNLRLFDVQFDNIDNRDYQKIETHVCFKF
ncbi:MAG: Opr family porin [Candidatus Omnitrophica bacterium]|nr:Opr family porin [Candidatus Omnitrophota bacterium]